MSLIIDPNAPLDKPKANAQALPTVSQITDDLGTMLAQLMGFFRANSVPGFYINSIGLILSQLKFSAEDRQSAADIQIMTQKQAAQQLEDMRLWLLKQSVPSGSIN